MSAILIGASIAATAATAGISASQQHQAQKKAGNIQRDALAAQEQEKQRLLAEAAAAPEQERQAELEKRRRRVKTLLSDQEATGMATVGQKTLLGG